jgi:hypothetical protein
VLLLHLFPKADPGTTYQGWARLNGHWKSVGTATPDAEGNAVIVAEGPSFTFDPDAVMVTREPWMGSPTPRGAVIVSWNR